MWRMLSAMDFSIESGRRRKCLLLFVFACLSRAASFLLLSAGNTPSLAFRRTLPSGTRSASPSLLYSFVPDPMNNYLNIRAADESARSLLNETCVGYWNSSCFEEAERIIHACSGWQSRWPALIAERLLRRIVEEQMVSNPEADAVDMTALYNALIRSWARSGEQGGAERAEEILDYMQNLYEEGDCSDPLLCGPGISAFNAVLFAYASSGRSDALSNAMRVLAKLYDWYHSGKTNVAPNTETYAAVLRAFAKRGTKDAHETVRKLLVHMDEMSATYPSVKPDYNCHNSYLVALLDAAKSGQLPGYEGARLADEWLRKMLENQDDRARPDTWTFNFVLLAWSRSGSHEMVHRAEKLIELIEAYHEECGKSQKTRPNANTYNVQISCYARSTCRDRADKALQVLQKMESLADSGENPSVRPDRITYNSVMNAYAKSRMKNAPQKVEELLCIMQERYAAGDRTLKPNGRSYNTCLEAWAKSGIRGSADRIMEWINKMNAEAKAWGKNATAPNKWTYNSYLQALSKSGGASMADEAERVLAEMNEQYAAGNLGLKPDVLTFTNVIHCIALSGCDDALERALKILNRMEDLHSQGFGDVRPNIFTYNCVINAAAKSNMPGKARIALRILRRMESAALRPMTVSLNNVLNACAFSGDRDDPAELVDVALEVLNEAKQGPGANWITYQTALRVVGTFEPNETRRLRLTREIVHQCKDDGQFTKSVLQQVRFALPMSQFAPLRRQLVDERGRLRREYTVNARKTKKTPAGRTLRV